MATLARRARHSPNTWPGFVDALASLLMVIIFLLLIFVLAQFFLGQALSGRDQAIRQLESRIGELANLLQMERSSNKDLRDNLSQLSEQLQASVKQRDNLSQRVVSLKAENEKSKTALSQAFNSLMSQQEVSAKQQKKIASLAADIESLKALKKDLEDKVFKLAGELQDAKARATQAESDLSQAASTLEDKQRRIIVLEQNLKESKKKVNQTQDLLVAEQKVSESAQAKVAQLNQNLQALRQQLATLSAQLDASEAKAKQQNVKIESLGKRLNAALANKVQELSEYRSEFFGKLRQILGDRSNIRIVGDRFVFQSEVLFPKAEADLQPAGQKELDHLASVLQQIIPKIPANIDWVLRVDGHTDSDPIHTARFPSNWELSAARAISVVDYLIGKGIPADRLVAAGFGQYSPIAKGDTEAAKRRNRRIEFELTNR